MNAKVAHASDIQLTDLGGGSCRKVLSYDERMMVVEVRFEEGAVGAKHTHPHSQSTYVASGRFRFTIDGEDVEVGAGDAITFAPDVPHGTLCIEKGVLVDVFAPMREDFV